MTVRVSAPARRRGRDTNAPDRRLLRSRASRLLRALDESRSELSVSLVGDDEIARLNRDWRGKRGPTDVLSFSLVAGEHADHRGRLLGDVVIGLDVAARQARERRRSLDDELARLLIHGVLHLLGHDHVRAAEARRMQTEERRLWREIRG